jgi:hypothetical protein
MSSSWNDRIEAERKEAQQAGLLASDCDSMGWDKLASADRELVEACDRKIAALQKLKEITENYDLWTAFENPEFREAVKQVFVEKGLWPPKSHPFVGFTRDAWKLLGVGEGCNSYRPKPLV